MPPTGPPQPDASAQSAIGIDRTLLPNALRSLVIAVSRHKRFESIEVSNGALMCAARGSDSPAFYKIVFEAGRLCISLLMADRYLSQSIEQDLVHNGDKLSDLLADELIDADVRFPAGCPPLTVDHFRDTHKLFTFRTFLPAALVALDRLVTPEAAIAPMLEAGAAAEISCEPAVHRLVAVLLAYESCFSRLGGMSAGANED